MTIKASEKQLKFLKGLGYTGSEDISMQEASDNIKKLQEKKAESTPQPVGVNLARREKLIIRQSQVKAAVDMMRDFTQHEGNALKHCEAVLAVAQKFEDWVNRA